MASPLYIRRRVGEPEFLILSSSFRLKLSPIPPPHHLHCSQFRVKISVQPAPLPRRSLRKLLYEFKPCIYAHTILSSEKEFNHAPGISITIQLLIEAAHLLQPYSFPFPLSPLPFCLTEAATLVQYSSRSFSSSHRRNAEYLPSPCPSCMCLLSTLALWIGCPLLLSWTTSVERYSNLEKTVH